MLSAYNVIEVLVAQLLNGKPLILNVGAFLWNGDDLVLSEMPWIGVKVNEMETQNIKVQPSHSGFQIDLNGFIAGTDLTSYATGTLGDRNITIITKASRVAEFSDGALYRVDCMMAEV